MIFVDRLIPFLVENEISDRQFMILYLSYLKRQDLLTLYKEKVLEGMKVIPKTEMNELKEKGFLKFNTRNEYVLTDKFFSIFIDKHTATDEIFAIYPSFMTSMGVEIPLSAMDRNIFANIYISAIQGNLEEHKEIMRDIEFGKANNLLNFGIEKFVSSKFWLQLRERRLANKVKITTKTAADNEF